MAEVFSSLAQTFNDIYYSINSALGNSFESILVMKLIFFMGLITLAALFIWKFYNSLSDKDIISIDLSKYNTSSHPFFSKLFAILLYLVEYILFTPIIIALWSTALAIILLIVTKQRTIDEVLIISFALVGAVRIMAYFKQEIAVDLAKMFPLTILAIFLLEPGALNVANTISQLERIPLLLNSLLYFLVVVFIIELFLRMLNLIYDFWFSEDEKENERKFR